MRQRNCGKQLNSCGPSLCCMSLPTPVQSVVAAADALGATGRTSCAAPARPERQPDTATVASSGRQSCKRCNFVRYSSTAGRCDLLLLYMHCVNCYSLFFGRAPTAHIATEQRRHGGGHQQHDDADDPADAQAVAPSARIRRAAGDETSEGVGPVVLCVCCCRPAWHSVHYISRVRLCWRQRQSIE